MAVYTYSRIPAFNPNTSPVSVARSASGAVYDIGDTGFTTPLNLTLVVGNVATTTLISDANAMFPDFTLLNRTSVVFKSGSAQFVLTTTDPVPGPTGPPGPNTVPTAAAILAEVTTPGTPTYAAQSATFVPKWKATTAYLAGDKVLNPGGDVVSAIANFTSGASYNAANWVLPTTYVRFVDLAGNPISARHVTIKVDTSTWEIADIIAEA